MSVRHLTIYASCRVVLCIISAQWITKLAEVRLGSHCRCHCESLWSLIVRSLEPPRPRVTNGYRLRRASARGQVTAGTRAQAGRVDNQTASLLSPDRCPARAWINISSSIYVWTWSAQVRASREGACRPLVSVYALAPGLFIGEINWARPPTGSILLRLHDCWQVLFWARSF